MEIDKIIFPAYNQEIQVTKDQYKKAVEDLSGYIFNRKSGDKYYLKLATSKMEIREKLHKIITI